MVMTVEFEGRSLTKMCQPLITIGILCYNAKSTIGRAIESALAQDWMNTEILIVDDGSTDGSMGIINGYLQSHSNIKAIRHETNRGTPASRNSILENFSGEYLAFFDDDDYSYPDRLTRQYEKIVHFHEEFVLCYGDREIVGRDSFEHMEYRKGLGSDAGFVSSIVAETGIFNGQKALLDRCGCWGTCILMGHRNTFDKIGRFDERFRRGQDFEYAIRASLQGAYFTSVQGVVIRQYMTDGFDKRMEIRARTQPRIVRKYKDVISESRFYFYELLVAYAVYHERVGNKWRFKLLRSVTKRLKKVLNFYSKTFSSRKTVY